MAIKDRDVVVSEIDHKKLHAFILKIVSNELSSLVEDCYYPKISTIYKDLLHLTNSTEENLIAYSKKKYGRPKYWLLHDPQTTLLIIIVQEFLKINDVAAAMSAFHLLSLRTYTNIMHRYIKFCNPEYFRTALGMLSQNHLFIQKQTIASSIIYLSNTLFRKYQDDLVRDDPNGLADLVYEIRTRFNQSMKSFAVKYYKVHQGKSTGGGSIKSEEEKDYDVGYETKIKQFVDTIAKNITAYKKIDTKSLEEARSLTKFNRDLSSKYVETLGNIKYTNDVNNALYLLLKDLGDYTKISPTQYLDYVKRLMSIKVSKQPIYFKKVVVKIHDQIIQDLKIVDWFNNLSIQSKATSRSFVAYYLAIYARNFISV